MIFSQSVFYDTSAWIALHDQDDDCHEEALELHKKASLEKRLLVTSNLVFAETHAFFSRFPKQAFRVGEAIRSSRVISYQRILPEDEERGWSILKKYKDKEFSFCDAVSFALIERLEIPFTLSFDDHFRQYGITLFKTSPH